MPDAEGLHLQAQIQGGNVAQFPPALDGHLAVFSIHAGHDALRTEAFNQLPHKFRALHGLGADDHPGDAV